MGHLDDLGKVNLAVESFVVCGNKVLLFKRSESSSKFPGWWTIPGGHIDETEDAITAAAREVKEETGIGGDEKSLKIKAIVFNYHVDYGDVWISFVYLATLNAKQKVSSEDETEGLGKWFPIKEVLTMEKLFPPIKFELQHALTDTPGILYTNITWENSEIVRINSQRVDRNY
jgi:8-oxo-dGTP pyrophosphatase MutT (NUDIX family)